MAVEYILPDPADNIEDPKRDRSGDQRVTGYISPQQDKDMGMLIARLHAEHNLKAKKTDLVQAALAFMLADLHLNGANAWTVRRLRAMKGATA